MKDKSLTTYFMTSLPQAGARPPVKKRSGVAAHRKQDVQYGDDIYSWALNQCALLESGRLDEIDIVNLVDEIGDVARREYDKLESALEVLIAHLLKWDHQPRLRSRSWRLTIQQQRLRVQKQLRRNPGLKSCLGEAVQDGFDLGRIRAAHEMGVEPSTLPSSPPYDWSSIMDRVFDDEAS